MCFYDTDKEHSIMNKEEKQKPTNNQEQMNRKTNNEQGSKQKLKATEFQTFDDQKTVF